MRKDGNLIKYSGRNVFGNFLIKSFDSSHPNTIWGGANFEMELVECRIAKSAYNPSEQTSSGGTPKLEIGAIVVFKGGPVYRSSDATKAATSKGRQTCKITNINTRSWSKHDYHLISTEKQYPDKVYGWVDAENIEGAGTSNGDIKTSTNSTSDGGTQQTKNVQTYETRAADVKKQEQWSIEAEAFVESGKDQERPDYLTDEVIAKRRAAAKKRHKEMHPLEDEMEYNQKVTQHKLNSGV